jgi:hypothetical protein
MTAYVFCVLPLLYISYDAYFAYSICDIAYDAFAHYAYSLVTTLSSPTLSTPSVTPPSSSRTPPTPTLKLTTTPPTEHTIATYKMNSLIDYISFHQFPKISYSATQEIVFKNITTEI